MPLTLGVDPGAGGAFAILDGDQLLGVWDMPTMEETTGGKTRTRLDGGRLAAVIRDFGPLPRAVVERVSSRPGQGVASSFAFGTSYGLVLGVLHALDIPVTLVTPQTWRRAAGLPSGLPKAAGKTASRHRAAALWPDLGTEFRRAKDDGKAEACLIGRFG